MSRGKYLAREGPGSRLEAGGLQRQQAGTAFANLLSAMEALPEAFLAGKSWIFITELRLVHLWVKPSHAWLLR